MKKLLAITVGGALAFFAFQSEVKAGTDFNEFVDKVKTFFENAQDKIDAEINKVKAFLNSPKVQAKLEQIRLEHRAKLKEVLLAVYPKIVSFRNKILPIIEARIQVKLLQLQAKLVDSLKIFKAQATKLYEAELDKFITKLPDELEAKVRAIRASEAYQSKKAEVIAKIDAEVLKAIDEASDNFSNELTEFVNDKLAELDAKILAKIESL
jgi:hypothetical protein